MVVPVAQDPAEGVKVYVVVAVLFKAGDHVPTIPLLDVVGKADNDAPVQIAATCVKVGTTGWSTVIEAEPEAIHPLESVPTTE